MRGKFRRAFNKVYKKLIKYYDEALIISVIHSSKLSLFIIFVVASTNGPTIINAILFILFLILTTISYQNMRLIWKLTIIYDSAIILTFYAVEVFNIDS